MPAAVSNVYTYLRKLLSGERALEKTYSAATGRYSEFEPIEVKTTPDVLGHPLAAALNRAIGIAPLDRSYHALLGRSAISFRPDFEFFARSLLAKPVQQHIFSSDKPDFNAYLASIDDKTKNDLAGRYLSAILISYPEEVRSIVGGQRFDATLRDRLVMDLTMRLYPGVADVAAQHLLSSFHDKYAPVISQMTSDEVRSAVESFVNMFDIDPSERQIAVKRILADPARVSLAVGVVHGGESIDSLKQFLTKRFGREQAQQVVKGLITGDSQMSHLRTLFPSKRPVVAELYTYPEISRTPKLPGPLRRLSERLGIAQSPTAVKPENMSTILQSDLDELELILGEVEAASAIVDRRVQLKTEEWSRVGEVLNHLYNKFGTRFPGLSVKSPPPELLGAYRPRTHTIETSDKLPVFAHEFGHSMNYPLPIENSLQRTVSEIAADAFSIAFIGYVKGLDDHPLVQSAKRAGLLPGGSDVVKTPIDWVVEDVIPYFRTIGPSRSRLGDGYINIRRMRYGYKPPIPESEFSKTYTTPIIDILTKGFFKYQP